MPTLTKLTRKYNAALYESLMTLFMDWKDITAPDELATWIAHESALEMDIHHAKLNRGLSALERKDTVQRYLESLSKARKIWLEMENNDQISLSGCLTEIDSGHLITEDAEVAKPRLLWASFKPAEGIAEWRREALSKHQFWGADTEMLDLLIGAAQAWLQKDSPKPYSKIDPTLYAVIRLGELCQRAGIEPSPASSSRFTQIVQSYFQHTFTGSKADPENLRRTSFKDLIRKANELRVTDYKDYFDTQEDS